MRELLGPGAEPQIEPVLGGAQLAGQLRVKSFGVVHQITGMHLEEPRQHHARRVGEVRTRAALELRQVRLAQAASQFLLERVGQLLLCHLAVHVAQGAFDQPEVAKFFAEFHIAISNYTIAICNVKNSISKAVSEIRAEYAAAASIVSRTEDSAQRCGFEQHGPTLSK